ncbi:MAG: hypothetical protein O7A64_04130, partial [Alphaproteobacteria bacterium]|nr:hypothetical protein [Alphaproteobacteria bacterium]
VEIVQPGRVMRVVMPADALFLLGGTEIRPARFPLLDRLVAALSGRPPGVRFDMEFLIGSAYTPDNDLPLRQTLEMARAGAFARAMLSGGTPTAFPSGSSPAAGRTWSSGSTSATRKRRASGSGRRTRRASGSGRRTRRASGSGRRTNLRFGAAKARDRR